MFLPKLFIKNYRDTSSPSVRKAYGVLSGVVGIIVNVILSAAKVVAGLLFSSIAIVADGLNNLSDAGSSVVSIVGFKIADRPPDREHPFGHARVEYISGMIISFIIMMLGLQLVISSVEGIIKPSGGAEFNYVVLGILAFGIVAKLGLSIFNRGLSKAIDSAALKAASTDSLTDVAATAAVLISLVISHFTGVDLDAYMGLVVAAFIIFSGVRVLKETMSPLLGEKPNSELVERIFTKIHSYEHVLGIHDLVVHNYGPSRNFASVHVEVDSKRDIMESHELIDAIERDFESEGIHLVIHLDPIVTDDERANELKELVNLTLAEIDSRLSLHDFRTVPGKTRTNVIFDLVIPQKFDYSDSEMCELVQQKLHERDDTLYTVISIDRNYLG